MSLLQEENGLAEQLFFITMRKITSQGKQWPQNSEKDLCSEIHSNQVTLHGKSPWSPKLVGTFKQ